MKLYLHNTIEGLKPCYDEDYDEKKKLKIGQTYLAEIRPARNIQHHRKYFALINTAWAYQCEAREEFFHKDVNSFRKCVEMAAGYCDKVFSIARQEWLEVPKSISFDKMDQAEFEELYERVKDVLFQCFLENVSEDEFMRNLNNF